MMLFLDTLWCLVIGIDVSFCVCVNLNRSELKNLIPFLQKALVPLLQELQVAAVQIWCVLKCSVLLEHLLGMLGDSILAKTVLPGQLECQNGWLEFLSSVFWNESQTFAWQELPTSPAKGTAFLVQLPFVCHSCLDESWKFDLSNCLSGQVVPPAAMSIYAWVAF